MNEETHVEIDHVLIITNLIILHKKRLPINLLNFLISLTEGFIIYSIFWYTWRSDFSGKIVETAYTTTWDNIKKLMIVDMQKTLSKISNTKNIQSACTNN